MSNDPSFGVSRPIRLVALGCSTLYLLASTVVSSSSAVTRLVISICLRLLFDLGVDVVAVHRGAVQNTALLDFFDRQPWATVSPLSTGEYVVLIHR